jgi:hypothetical protein
MNIRNNFVIVTFLFLGLFVSNLSLAKNLLFTDLHNKDLDQMRSLIKPYIQKSSEALEKQRSAIDEVEVGRYEAEAVAALRQALKIIFSRPSKDNMTHKLIDEIQSRLTALNMYNISLMHLTRSAITVLSQKSLPKEYLATHVFILENLMSQIRPMVSYQKKYQEILIKIKDAKIEVPEKAIRMRRMRGMHKTVSPSLIAETILKKAKVKIKD